ncbi:MAG TPA: ABC transporter substrate-binding protein [Gemmataceae bacterium]
MRRRDFIATALAALEASRVAVAAPGARVYRVGILTPSPQQWEPKAFRNALAGRGYVEGRNLALDVRSADGRLDRLPMLAAGLAAAQPDVIVAVNTPGARAAIAATKTVPIVMAVVGDPVGSGFVSSLARPGGNVTGISNLSAELAAKRLSILKELVPTARNVGILFNPNDPVTTPQLKDTGSAAPLIDVEIRPFPTTEIAALQTVFGQLSEWHADAALWLAGQAASLEKGTIGLARDRKLPIMYILKRDVRAGGLVSYFAEYIELFGKVGLYVSRILGGEKPADLPVEQPTKFELAINLKTVHALGLTVPPALLARADEVSE